MTLRKALPAVLLGFVLVSFGYLALRSTRAAREWRSPVAAQAGSDSSNAEADPRTGPDKVIAYYFHTTVRCATCRNIEAYSKEVIYQRFAKELQAGRLEWRLVNVQLAENHHFIQDFELFTKSLVLVRTQNGQRKEHKVLNDTWELVGNKAAMQGYVEKEVRSFLRKLG